MEKIDKLSTFTGEQDVDEFLEKVSLHVSLKGYVCDKKAQFLASKLSQGAFQVYRRMSADDKKDFTKLTDELRKEYKRGSRDREAALDKLKDIKHCQGKSIVTHAFEIEELVKLAYPEFNAASCQALAKDYFIKSVHEDMEVALKSKYEKIKEVDLAAMARETDRLSLAGVKVHRKLNTVDVNAIACGSNNSYDVDAIVEKVMSKLNLRGNHSDNHRKMKMALPTL